MTIKKHDLPLAIQTATNALYRALEDELKRPKPDAAKLEIQVTALRIALEGIQMAIHASEENRLLLNMVTRAVQVAQVETSRYHEGKSGVRRLERTIDALCDVLLVCERAGFDLGAI